MRGSRVVGVSLALTSLAVGGLLWLGVHLGTRIDAIESQLDASWEYRVMALDQLGMRGPINRQPGTYDFDFPAIRDRLNELGAEGWELVLIRPPSLQDKEVSYAGFETLGVRDPSAYQWQGFAILKRRTAK